MHIERLNTKQTRGILDGKVHVFTKIDGTSGRIGFESHKVIFGSRQNILDATDNQGFKATMLSFYSEKIFPIFSEYDIVLYGEFLKPHTIRNYNNDAWNKFYIYDVWDNETVDWMPYEEYAPILTEYGIDFIPPIGIYDEFTTEDLSYCLENANFLLKEEFHGYGEGIVIKRYGFKNDYGNTVWAKVIGEEFLSASHHKGKQVKEIVNYDNEHNFVTKVFTDPSIEKEIWKFINDNGSMFDYKMMFPMLTFVTDELIKEEIDEITDDKYIGIDIRKVKSIAFGMIKYVLNENVLPKLAML